jgi:dTDP-4-amino-4,6-dideoxygalactose transaminase
LSKAAQEHILRSIVRPGDLSILRCANLFGLGQERVIARMARAASVGRPIDVSDGVVRTFSPVGELVDVLCDEPEAGTFNVGSTVIALDDLASRIMRLVGVRVPVIRHAPPNPDSCGVVDATLLGRSQRRGAPFDVELSRYVRTLLKERTTFRPPLPVVVPPRPERPDTVAERIQHALWSGELKHGNRWTTALEAKLRRTLEIGSDRRLVLTDSGTSALRLSLIAVVGLARKGDVAVLPSFTYPATGEVLAQLGYELRYCDIDDRTWTLDPSALEEILDQEPRVRVVVPVDSLGNPCDYERILAACARRDIAVVADSAAALGSLHKGVPVGIQAPAHAFSLSFAKVVSAGGAGGFAVVPAAANLEEGANWQRSSLMGELSAICALDQVDVLDQLIARRIAVANLYDQVCDRNPFLRCQAVNEGNRHSRTHWMVRIASADRDELGERLASVGVQTKTHYTPLMHVLLGEDGDGIWPLSLPISDLVAREALALPISSEMSISDAERVVDAVEAFLRAKRRPAATRGDRDMRLRLRWAKSRLDDMRAKSSRAGSARGLRAHPERARTA